MKKLILLGFAAVGMQSQAQQSGDISQCPVHQGGMSMEQGDDVRPI
jgi:hypothetical protein